jgi:RNA polymerase sigma factor (sigma-70 family)
MAVRLELFADNVDVAAEAERRYLRDGLRRAIGRLPERQRQAVVLTLLDHHSLSEAARRLGVTAQAVHSLRKRGLERLKKDCADIL